MKELDMRNIEYKFWPRLRHDLRQFLKTIVSPSQSMARLARFQAYKMSGKEVDVKWYELVNDKGDDSMKWIARITHPTDPTKLIDVLDSVGTGKKRRLVYNKKPNEELIIMYGREYMMRPGSYLTLT